jgi:hypothetical protein
MWLTCLITVVDHLGDVAGLGGQVASLVLRIAAGAGLVVVGLVLLISGGNGWGALDMTPDSEEAANDGLDASTLQSEPAWPAESTGASGSALAVEPNEKESVCCSWCDVANSPESEFCDCCGSELLQHQS